MQKMAECDAKQFSAFPNHERYLLPFDSATAGAALANAGPSFF